MIPERQAAVDALIAQYFTKHSTNGASGSKRSRHSESNGSQRDGTTSEGRTDEAGSTSENDDAENKFIAAARKRFGKQFDALFVNGEVGNDASKADYKLCLMFAQVGATLEQIVNLVGRSALGDRDKWQRPFNSSGPETYGEHTAQAALDALEHERSDAPQRSAATLLVELLEERRVEWFRDEASIAFARVMVGEHLETHPVMSREFRAFALREFYEQFEKTINNRALADALSQIEAIALYRGEQHPVHLRFAAREGETYVDLCNATWQQVRVTAGGYVVIEAADSPARFIRKQHMLPLPLPGTPEIGALRRLLNLKDTGFMLVVSFMVSAMRGEGPYPLLMILGEQGACKSSTLSTIRRCLDPNASERRTAPRDERTLAVGAAGNAIVSYDNVSYISDELSDALCRLSTGGGVSERKLYSDDQEILFAHMRPVVTTGITEIARRGDLLDRAISVTLDPINEEARIEDTQYCRSVETARPHIFAALLEAVACAHRNLEVTRRERKRRPRMADFFLWSCAAAPAFGFSASDFENAYRDVRSEAHAAAIEGSLLAQSLLTLCNDKLKDPAFEGTAWEGTAAQLLAELDALETEQNRKHRSWPATPQALGNALSRLAPHLRESRDLSVERARDSAKNRTRLIALVINRAKSRPDCPPEPETTAKPNNDGIFSTDNLIDGDRPGSSDSGGTLSDDDWESPE